MTLLLQIDLIFEFWCYNATFKHRILDISWRPVFLVEEAVVPGENHRPSIGKLTILVN